ncbi:MAG: galactokinase [Leptospiraceae bacterium]|nr:galactokinase [Leptospiraceae bacterium]
MQRKELLINAFSERFGLPPQYLAFAPGRINLIGEHIDYLGGIVLPAAVQQGITMVAGPHPDQKSILIRAMDMNAEVEWTAADLANGAVPTGWQAYLWGVLAELRKAGAAWTPLQIVFSGDVPAGSGLSSSAALEVAAATLFTSVQNLSMDPRELALLCQRAEQMHVGTNCGIMDQFASVFGQEHQFIELNCASLDYRLHPLDLGDSELVLVNSMISHNLGADYNQIRADLETARSKLAVASLLEISLDELTARRSVLGDPEYRRARHACSEFRRVKESITAIASGRWDLLGDLMSQSHISLSRDLGVSTPELDFLIKQSTHCSGWLGGRMMGGGFGGCTLNLIACAMRDSWLEQLTSRFESEFGVSPEVYPVQIGGGAVATQLD